MRGLPVRRQQPVDQVAPGDPRGRRHDEADAPHSRRRPFEEEEEHEEHHEPEPVGRDGEAEQREEAADLVEGAVRAQRRAQADRDADRRPQQHAPEHQLEGDGHAVEEFREDGLVAQPGAAEVEGDDLLGVDQELRRHRLVEAELAAHQLDLLHRRRRAGEQRDGILPTDAHQREGEEQDADEQRDREEQPPGEECGKGHALARGPPPRPAWRRRPRGLERPGIIPPSGRPSARGRRDGGSSRRCSAPWPRRWWDRR